MLTPDEHRALADCLRTVLALVEKMGTIPEPECFKPGQAYTSRGGAAEYMGCSREHIRQLIQRGLLTEYPAGIKITELMAYAAGKPAGAPSKEYRIEGLRKRGAAH